MTLYYKRDRDIRINTKKLRELRKRSGLTYRFMSELLGYEAINGYTRIESGEIRPTFDKLYIIAKTLGVPMEELIEDRPKGGDA